MEPARKEVTEIEVYRLKPNEHAIWRGLLSQCTNSIFYQSEEFIGYYSYKTSAVHKLIFYKKGKAIALLPAGIIDTQGELELRAPFSASFGGISHINNLKLKDALGIVSALEGFCKHEAISYISIQQPPIIYYKEPSEIVDFALMYCGFTMQSYDLTCYLSTLKNSAPSVLRNVQKALRNELICEESFGIGQAWEFINEQKKMKGLPLSITKEEGKDLYNLFPEHIKCFVVRLRGKLVGAIIVYLLNEQAALGFAWAQDEQYQDLRPTDLMLYSVVEKMHATGFKYFDMGTITLSGEPAWGVTRFKENFRPSCVLRKRFIKNIA